MAKLVALRRIQYPRGRNSREVKPGEEFETLSDRDAKAFLTARYAKVADQSPRTRDMVAEKPKPAAPVVSQPADDVPTKRVYKRRDMVAEGE